MMSTALDLLRNGEARYARESACAARLVKEGVEASIQSSSRPSVRSCQLRCVLCVRAVGLRLGTCGADPPLLTGGSASQYAPVLEPTHWRLASHNVGTVTHLKAFGSGPCNSDLQISCLIPDIMFVKGGWRELAPRVVTNR